MRPLAVLMENVPDILNHGGHNIVEEIADALDPLGYDARYSLLNSAHHGVPQTRDRVFMVAVHRALSAAIKFPRATHRCDLPPGYSGTRSVALRLVDRSGGGRYVLPDTGTPDLPHAVTAAEAISDLPAITLHRKGLLRRGARRFDEFAPYGETNLNALSPYARLMRSWPGFEAREGVYDHVIRSLPRDTEIFEAMTPGDEYPAAHRVARRLFEAEARRRRLASGSAAWDALSRQMVPPYDPGKVPNRWWKLRADFPARTLMAHIGKDTYSHIHYDSAQGRVISVREAARLQSFPDGFVFAGTMNPAYRQIGNAVPPIMAKEMAVAIRLSLEEALSARRTEPLKAAE
jgi:DNA (cytosine-5)-methyltransferase 1